MLCGALGILICLTIVGLVGYDVGKSACERCTLTYENDFNFEEYHDNLLIGNYLKVKKFEISSLCFLVISCGIAIGLIFHGFPFRFDFRRSTVYNEYSEDDDLGEDE